MAVSNPTRRFRSPAEPGSPPRRKPGGRGVAGRAASFGSPPMAAAAEAFVWTEAGIDRLQHELDAVHRELVELRRRDETLHTSMHRLDEELRLAARLQRDFLPRHPMQIGRINFDTLYCPAGHVSGDLYDICRLDERHVGFYVADAVGHGMPAALLTIFIKNAVVTKEILSGGYRLLEPGETLGRLNRAMIAQNLSNATFATAVYGIIDTETLQLHYARAGHPYPLLGRPGSNIAPLEVEGGLLGIFPEETYETKTMQLQAGDRLIVHTDGVDVAFGNAARPKDWLARLQERAALPTPRLLSDLARSFHVHTHPGALRDDLTMMVLDVR